MVPRRDAMRKFKRRGVIVSAFVVILAVAAVVGTAVALGGASEGPDELRDVHGFRTGVEGQAEDDLIALWHAFDREHYIRECMDEAGFSYSIAVAYPHESMLTAARSLGLRGDISPYPRLLAEIDILQTAKVSALTISDRDAYYQRLLGETAEDVAYVDATGFLPEGRNDFAKGGCRGVAWDQIPGHYVIRDEILAEFREAKALESGDIAECVTESGLVLDGPEALAEAYDDLVASGMSPSSVESSLRACEEHLEAENDAASERARATIFERHEIRLKEHHERFEDVIEKIESDREFLVYLDSLVVDLEREFARADAPDTE